MRLLAGMALCTHCQLAVGLCLQVTLLEQLTATGVPIAVLLGTSSPAGNAVPTPWSGPVSRGLIWATACLHAPLHTV